MSNTQESELHALERILHLQARRVSPSTTFKASVNPFAMLDDDDDDDDDSE